MRDCERAHISKCIAADGSRSWCSGWEHEKGQNRGALGCWALLEEGPLPLR